MSAPSPVGVVGIGLMGTALAGRLVGAGFDVVGFDVDGAKTTGGAALLMADAAEGGDARLVALCALDAAERGAQVLTRTRCTSLRPDGAGWRAELSRREIPFSLIVSAKSAEESHPEEPKYQLHSSLPAPV